MGEGVAGVVFDVGGAGGGAVVEGCGGAVGLDEGEGGGGAGCYWFEAAAGWMEG